MNGTDIAVDVLSLPMPPGWWREFRDSWITSQVEPWQTRLRILLGAPATRHWNGFCVIATNERSGAVLSAAVIDVPRRQVPPGFRYCWLSHVYTVPEARGEGLATRLVGHAVDHAKNAQVEEIMLATALAQEQSSLYRNVGFRPAAQSGSLMQLKVAGSERPETSTARSVFSNAFEVRVDDLGACAGIGARPHYALQEPMVREESLDIEEVLCVLLSEGPLLGAIRYQQAPEGAAIGVWSMPAHSTATATLIATSAPNPHSLAEFVSSSQVTSYEPSEQFTYLTAHESVA